MPTPAALSRLAEFDPHLSLAQLVKHAGLSVGALRGDSDGLRGEALPCYRIGGQIVVKCPEYGGWVQQLRCSRLPRR